MVEKKSKAKRKDGTLKEKQTLVEVDKKPEPAEVVPYFQLFRYSTVWERCAVALGVVFSAGPALGMIWLISAYGEFNSMFVDRTVPERRQFLSSPTVILQAFGGGEQIQNATELEARQALLDDCLAYGLSFLAQSLVTFFTALISVHLLNWAALGQIMRIRLRFLESILRQDAAYFDTESSLNFASRMVDDLEKLKEGIAEKVVMFTYLVLTALLCCIISFVYGWQLTLACLAAVPFSLAVAGIVSKLQSESTMLEQEACNDAGRVVEESLGAVRTVVAFGGEQKEIDRYTKRLAPAERHGKTRGIYSGLTIGLSMIIMYTVNSIGFIYGVRLVQWDLHSPPEEKVYHSGVILTILFNILIAAQNIAMSAPHVEAFSTARGAAAATFKLLERTPGIDSLAEDGAKPKRLEGRVKIDDVHFMYPSRPDVRVLRGFSLEVSPGETVALVGPSGCGKSTVMQLLQRFYDPIIGDVELDGKNVRKLNLQWLRSRIGVVGQEPVLFAGTIRENIAMGKDDATMEEIQLAAKQAFAHDFIQNLTDGYDTVIGERGAQLSGGQKQRIAIARSLVRDPPLLLLDEATSALDPQSEKKVQAALDKASKGRTTICVSHRLSGIMTASRIVCMDAGRIVEEGTYQELMQSKGFFWKMVTSGNELTEPPAADAEEGAEETDEVPVEDAPLRRKSTKRSHHTRRGSESVKSVNWNRRRSSVASAVSFGFSNYSGVHGIDALIDDSEDEEDEKVSDWALVKMNAPEWPLLVTGSLAALLQGCSFPAFSVLFALVFGLFTLGEQNEKIFALTDLYSGLLIVIAVIAGLAMFTQTAAFNTAGLKLTSRLRIQAFTSYLSQEMGFFDDKKNSVGALCARIAGDAGAVQGATGMRVGIILQGVSTLFVGVIVAFCYSWKMTLVGIVFIPFVVGGIWMEGWITRHAAEKEKEAMEEATEIATEAITSIRTVQSLAMERQIIERYSAALENARRATIARTRWRGTVYGLGLSAPLVSYNAALLYGGTLVANENMPYETALLVVESLMHGMYMLGQALVFAPNFMAAKASAARILGSINRKPKIYSEEGISEKKEWEASGDFDMTDVRFTYPTRPDHKVLNGLDLKVESGKKVALVGASGCGKSTCLQLLQRFYDADSGTIELDSWDIRHSLTLPRLRRQLGVVSQEPVLFDRSIAENIAYGDNTRKVTTAEIVAAAKAANIHSFIVGLPRGYDTSLGTGGAQLSGGQKQRICIARALVRSPRLLLLDEATSALDAQSQKVVSEALEKAGQGRTCVVIAHRLSTVQDADLICVIEKGRIVEKGTHAELMKLNGIYCRLQNMPDPA